ncbi:MAG: GAF domain-containing protein [Deltaproteobacteria bacterium]|nr:GAF domain-containing protein [Deltaproteobacteria bacterium]
MTDRVDLAEWLEKRLDQQIIAAGVKVEPIKDSAAKIVGEGGEVAVFTSDASRLPEPDEAPRVLVDDREHASLPEDFVDVVPWNASPKRLARTISIAHELFRLRSTEHNQELGLRRREYEVSQLVEIGKSLSAIRDVDRLLDMILAKARFLAGADAGSIYVIEGDADEIADRTLRFKLSQNDSLAYESKEFVMPVTTESIAGAAAIMKKTINLPDVRNLPKDAPFHYDPSSDERTGYHTRSILAVPMINQNDDVLGVVQLINKKLSPGVKLTNLLDFDREVIPVDARSQELVETLASQASVAMENAFLYNEIKHIFDGFVRASVHAIEQRDPTTSGHSFRVAALTRRLAEVVSDKKSGPYGKETFSEEDLKEIETAALLHDFGKVGVREEVLVKAKKLYAPNLKMIRARFDFIRRSIENDHLHRRLMMIEAGTPAEELEILDQASKRAIADIEECWRIIRSANEPTVLEAGDFVKIEEVATRSYFDLGGQRQPFLTSDEVHSLQIAKGSLTEEELEEIRSHAAHSISFLEQIQWSKSMRHIPKWSGAHHEKLDGSGYPYNLKEDQIPLPSKMMAVADIYDALTAADRPYKKAVPVERALSILEMEVKDNHIDGELVRLFKEAGVFQILDK